MHSAVSCKPYAQSIHVPKSTLGDFFKRSVDPKPRELGITPLMHTANGARHTYSIESGKLSIEVLENKFAVVVFTEKVFSNMCVGGKPIPVHEELADGSLQQIGSFDNAFGELLFQCAKAAFFGDGAAFDAVLQAKSTKEVKFATLPKGPTGGVQGFLEEPWNKHSPKYMVWIQFLKLTNPELFAFVQEIFGVVRRHGVPFSNLLFVEAAPWGDSRWGVASTLEQFCETLRDTEADWVLDRSFLGDNQNLLGVALNIAAHYILRTNLSYEQFCDEVLSHPTFIVGSSAAGLGGRAAAVGRTGSSSPVFGEAWSAPGAAAVGRTGSSLAGVGRTGSSLAGVGRTGSSLAGVGRTASFSTMQPEPHYNDFRVYEGNTLGAATAFGVPTSPPSSPFKPRFSPDVDGTPVSGFFIPSFHYRFHALTRSASGRRLPGNDADDSGGGSGPPVLVADVPQL